jgi:hypothetical protein
MDYDDNETDEDLRIKGMTDKELDNGLKSNLGEEKFKELFG